ncbi:MAG: hypothetical protein ACK4WH_03335 [Phycisphaerales bacterium]
MNRPDSSPRRVDWPQALGLALAGLVAATLSGCVDSFQVHRKSLESLYAAGDYAKAAAILDAPEGRRLYGDKNQLLYWLDRGSIALAQGQPEVAISNLERAEDFMEVRRELSAGDEIARWLINDTAAPYYGEPYEEQYVNVLKLLAQLEQGNFDGGATVEARRMAGKADVLRDRYLRALGEATKKGESSITGFSPPSLGQAYANPEGAFVESTLGTFLTAVTFMMTGDPGGQSVAARRLRTNIDAQAGLIGPVRAEDFESLGELTPGRVNALVVALSGRGPTKEPARFGPIPIYTYTVYFELPELRGGSAECPRARVVVDGDDPFTQELSLIEDMRSVAAENHRRQLPVIYLRAFLRSSLKAAAVAVGTEAARRGAGSRDTKTAIELAGILGGLLFVTQTEKADLRCWAFLPGQAHVGLMNLPPGRHTVRVEYLSDTGSVLHSTQPQEVVIQPGRGLRTIVEHYWR